MHDRSGHVATITGHTRHPYAHDYIRGPGPGTGALARDARARPKRRPTGRTPAALSAAASPMTQAVAKRPSEAVAAAVAAPVARKYKHRSVT